MPKRRADVAAATRLVADATPALTCDLLDKAGAAIDRFLEQPEWLLNPSGQEARRAAQEARSFTKLFFDGVQAHGLATSQLAPTGLGSLVIEGFDHDQIWEELQIQNVPLRRDLRRLLTGFSKAPKGSVDVRVSAPESGARPLGLQPLDAKPKQEDPVLITAARSDEVADDVKDVGGAVADADQVDNVSPPSPEADQETADLFDAEEMEQFTALGDKGKLRLDLDAGDSDFDELEADDEDDAGVEAAQNAKYADFFIPSSNNTVGKTRGSKKNKVSGDAAGIEHEGDTEIEDAASDPDLDDDDGDDEHNEDEQVTETANGARQRTAVAEDLSEEEKELEDQLQQLTRGNTDNEEDEEEDDDDDIEPESKLKTGVKFETSEEEAGSQKVGSATGKSLYEMDRRLQSLEEEVAKLEAEQLEAKPWTLQGEVSAKQRPLNSLLEVHLDQPMTQFAGRRAEDAAVAAGAAPDGESPLDEVAGAEGLARAERFDIEAVVRQRVWDEMFDDVERKTALPPAHRKQGAEEDAVETLNFEKSRVGLGEIYAQQYEAEVLGHASETKVKEDTEKAETRKLFVKLMHKLDLLTNAHFTPRPPMLGASGEQLDKVPSLKMEETIPLLVSDTLLKAPEEVRAPRRHERGREELTHEERVALRRTKKAMRKKSLEQKLDRGEMTMKGLRERNEKLDAKNREAKEERARIGQVKERKQRLKASDLLNQAAENAKDQSLRKDRAAIERQKKPANAPSSKRLKL